MQYTANAFDGTKSAASICWYSTLSALSALSALSERKTSTLDLRLGCGPVITGHLVI